MPHYPGGVRLTVTTDTGPVGDLRALADELDDQAAAFHLRTSDVPGVLGVCLRSLPQEWARRSTTRFVQRDGALDVDLVVAEERLAGATLDEQREVIGARLRDLLRRGVASRTAPWEAGQRAMIIDAADEALGRLGWIGGRRDRARQMLMAGNPLDDVSDATGLQLTEVETLYVTLCAET